MAVQYWQSCQVHLGAFDATTRANAAAVEIEAEQHDVTTFGSGGWREMLGGLKAFRWSVEGYQDFAASVDDSLGVTSTGAFTLPAASVFTIASASAAHSGAYFGQVEEGNYQPIMGQVGEPAKFTASGWGRGNVYRGWLGYPKGTVAATAQGSSSAALGSQNGKTAWFALHVFAWSGTSATVRLERSADGATSWTTVSAGTALSVSGTGAQLGSGTVTVAQQYFRVAVSAFTGTSMTFAASFGFV